MEITVGANGRFFFPITMKFRYDEEPLLVWCCLYSGGLGVKALRRPHSCYISLRIVCWHRLACLHVFLPSLSSKPRTQVLACGSAVINLVFFYDDKLVVKNSIEARDEKSVFVQRDRAPDTKLCDYLGANGPTR